MLSYVHQQSMLIKISNFVIARYIFSITKAITKQNAKVKNFGIEITETRVNDDAFLSSNP
jgi:hypothetical protein